MSCRADDTLQAAVCFQEETGAEKWGNYTRSKETASDVRKNEYIYELQDWTDVIPTIIQPRLSYHVQHENEAELDETFDKRLDYTYRWRCNAPLTAHAHDGFQPAAQVSLLSLRGWR